MGNVTLSPPEVLTAIAGAAAIVTAIWHAAMYVGKITVKLDRHEDRLNDHDDEIQRLNEYRIR